MGEGGRLGGAGVLLAVAIISTLWLIQAIVKARRSPEHREMGGVCPSRVRLRGFLKPWAVPTSSWPSASPSHPFTAPTKNTPITNNCFKKNLTAERTTPPHSTTEAVRTTMPATKAEKQKPQGLRETTLVVSLETVRVVNRIPQMIPHLILREREGKKWRNKNRYQQVAKAG